MNRRLNCILSHIPDGCGMIDVGTDHGYLPVALAQRGYSGRILASDIRVGPLQAAKRTAETAGLTDRVQFLLCDGLDACDPESIDTIVIAGMGGDTICGILDRAEWCLDARYTLVLQPMTRAEVLRYWLIYNGFAILEEDLVVDGGIVYAIVKARYGGETRLNEAELYTGSYSMLRQHPLFPAFLRIQRDRMFKSLTGITAGSAKYKPGREALLRAIVRQMEEMTAHEND